MRQIARLAARIAYSNLGELSLPYRLTYSVTNRCQAHCTMCNIWSKAADNELSLSEVDTLFSKANRFSWINLTGGELFQRPDITEIFLAVIKHSRNLYLLNFPTNGIQTNEIVTAVDAILTKTSLPKLIVSVSLDGPQQLHDHIRGVSGCWRSAITTFRELRERCSDRFSVYFGHTIQSANLGKFDETLSACQDELGCITVNDLHINLAHSSGHYYDNANTDAIPEAEQAMREIERISNQKTQKLLDPVAFIDRHYQKQARNYLKHGRVPFTCQAAAASCFIDPKGTVYPCSVFDSPLGSLREFDMDLYRLWHSTTRTNSRKSIINHACPACWTPCEAYQTILANLLHIRNV